MHSLSGLLLVFRLARSAPSSVTATAGSPAPFCRRFEFHRRNITQSMQEQQRALGRALVAHFERFVEAAELARADREQENRVPIEDIGRTLRVSREAQRDPIVAAVSSATAEWVSIGYVILYGRNVASQIAEGDREAWRWFAQLPQRIPGCAEACDALLRRRDVA